MVVLAAVMTRQHCAMLGQSVQKYRMIATQV
jgi:hypothetical protein